MEQVPTGAGAERHEGGAAEGVVEGSTQLEGLQATIHKHEEGDLGSRR